MKSSNSNQKQDQGPQVVSHWEPIQSKELNTTVQWQRIQYNSNRNQAEQHLETLQAYKSASQGLESSRKLEIMDTQLIRARVTLPTTSELIQFYNLEIHGYQCTMAH